MEFVKCLGHPEEFYNLVRFRIGGKRKVMPKMDQTGGSWRARRRIARCWRTSQRSPLSLEIWLRNTKQ
ncbi:FDFT1 isoform 9 [Pan troglodytes]|uniref:Farnesyl-diphosphate farnesyltransferase 1 n=2 Tax=Homininae TaxID=207598 RepID=E9PSH1_HUMAN|nr:farnesyl-diphosphate farnesyltransferase 1 [Homo sapiens]KAI4009492.1 farnesyl-diphosphate farnesyltransferase 1 [Homo sapiens]PNI92878.1 FDFT1 isoform 9 [Pan troglodytes]